jgi:hypothetical protein
LTFDILCCSSNVHWLMTLFCFLLSFCEEEDLVENKSVGHKRPRHVKDEDESESKVSPPTESALIPTDSKPTATSRSTRAKDETVVDTGNASKVEKDSISVPDRGKETTSINENSKTKETGEHKQSPPDSANNTPSLRQVPNTSANVMPMPSGPPVVPQGAKIYNPMLMNVPSYGGSNSIPSNNIVSAYPSTPHPTGPYIPNDRADTTAKPKNAPKNTANFQDKHPSNNASHYLRSDANAPSQGHFSHFHPHHHPMQGGPMYYPGGMPMMHPMFPPPRGGGGNIPPGMMPPPSSLPPPSSHNGPSSSSGKYSKGISLAMTCDADQLSEYQIKVRQQLELFEAAVEDADSNTQGRKKQIVLGQVGLRCRHCAMLPLRARGRGAVYYPAKLQGVYQAAQNMASSHLCQSCQQIPWHIKEEIKKLRERRDNASGGKQYWADACRALGLYETENGLRLHMGQGST